MAALKNSGLRDGHGGKATGTFRDGCGRTANVERRYESVAERFHFREGVRLTTLINHGKDIALLDRHLVGFEVPTRIRGSSLRPGEEIRQGGKRSERDVLAKVGAHGCVERGRIAFIQCHDLGETGRAWLRARVCRAN